MKYDFKNKRFGKLTIVADVGRAKDRSILWSYFCDCGNIGKIKSKNLVSGVKSCGCLRRIKTGQAAINRLFRRYQFWAKNRGLCFELSRRDFTRLTGSDCHYCGSSPMKTTKREFENKHYNYNGIDRKNNDAGYTKANSLPCCFICNRAKGNMSYEHFIQWIKRIRK